MFTLIFLPTESRGVRILSLDKAIFDTVAKTLGEDWTRLLLPMEYEEGRFYGQPGSIFLT